jgi:hypothetical protein
VRTGDENHQLAKGSSMGLEEPRTSLEMETRTTERSSVGGGGGTTMKKTRREGGTCRQRR